MTAKKTCIRDDSCKIFSVRDATTCFGYEFIGSKEYTNESLFTQKSEAHYQLSIEYARNSGLAFACPAIVVYPTPVLCEDTNCTGIGNLIKNIPFSARKCSTDSHCKSIALSNKKCSTGKSFFIYSNETMSDLEMAKQSQYYERLVANPNNSELSLQRYFLDCEFESQPNLSCINSVCRKKE